MEGSERQELREAAKSTFLMGLPCGKILLVSNSDDKNLLRAEGYIGKFIYDM